MWALSDVGHVTYSFINFLFISTGIFDELPTNFVGKYYRKCHFNIHMYYCWYVLLEMDFTFNSLLQNQFHHDITEILLKVALNNITLTSETNQL